MARCHHHTAALLAAIATLHGARAHAEEPAAIAQVPGDPSRLTVERDRPLALEVSYLGETLTHPGATVGVEVPITALVATRINSKRRRVRQLFARGALMGYLHPDNHGALAAEVGGGTRTIWHNTLKVEALGGVGYMFKWLAGTTYVVGEDGSLEEVGVAGRSKLLVHLALGVGQDFSWRTRAPWAWHIRPGVILEVPHNTVVLPHPVLHVGVTRALR